MSIEYFVVYNLIMAGVAWYLWKTHGETEYDNGFMDAVQLHSEGRLSYNVEQDEEEGTALITIEVTDEK